MDSEAAFATSALICSLSSRRNGFAVRCKSTGQSRTERKFERPTKKLRKFALSKKLEICRERNCEKSMLSRTAEKDGSRSRFDKWNPLKLNESLFFSGFSDFPFRPSQFHKEALMEWKLNSESFPKEKFGDSGSTSVSEGRLSSSEKRSTASNLKRFLRKVGMASAPGQFGKAAENRTERVLDRADFINRGPAGGEIIKNPKALFGIVSICDHRTA
jgi:hypothetical protein